MASIPGRSVAEFRAAPFRVNALEQHIRCRRQDAEDWGDAKDGGRGIAVDCEGEDRQAEVWSIVVFPTPFGPNRPKNSPRLTETSTPFKASTDP
jgi:hypothetical protein